MRPEDLSIAFILTAILIGCTTVFGVALLFAKAERIERPILVGILTIATSLIALGLLSNQNRLGLRGNVGGYLSLAVFASLGFLVGRAIDRILGPLRLPPEDEESRLDSGLSD